MRGTAEIALGVAIMFGTEGILYARKRLDMIKADYESMLDASLHINELLQKIIGINERIRERFRQAGINATDGGAALRSAVKKNGPGIRERLERKRDE